MAKNFLHVMQRHPALKPARAGFMSKVVKVQIDCGECRTRLFRQLAALLEAKQLSAPAAGLECRGLEHTCANGRVHPLVGGAGTDLCS